MGRVWPSEVAAAEAGGEAGSEQELSVCLSLETKMAASSLHRN